MASMMSFRCFGSAQPISSAFCDSWIDSGLPVFRFARFSNAAFAYIDTGHSPFSAICSTS